jgi:very-short-patch-repair endonuclease
LGNKLRGLAKNLRKSSTNTENYLWLFLRNRQVEGIKFRRQEPMGRYIVDFVSYERKLVIELDGGQHVINNKKDKERDEWFQSQGYEVLRFWDNEVLKNKDGVVESIRNKLLPPHPASPARGEEK